MGADIAKPPAKAPATPQEKFNTVRAMMESNRGQMQAAAPHILNLERQMRLALTTFQKNPALLDCHPATLVGAVIQVTQLGLDIDSMTNQVHLVPFKNNAKNRTDVTVIIGYKGLETLAIRTKLVKRIMARAVRAGDEFEYCYGTNPVLTHKPLNKTRDLTHVYAIAYLADGGTEFIVLTKEDVGKTRARSRAGSSGPWVTDYEEMALKTAIRKLCKRLPNASPDAAPLHNAIALDEKAEVGLPQDMGLLADPDNETATPPPATEPPARVEAPASASASEKPLAQRWTELQAKAKKYQVSIAEAMKAAGAKEVNNQTIGALEAAVDEAVEKVAGGAQE